MNGIAGRDVRRRESVAESRKRRLLAEARQARDRRIISYSARMLAMLCQPFRRSSGKAIQR
jgi:hypothetical protein